VPGMGLLGCRSELNTQRCYVELVYMFSGKPGHVPSLQLERTAQQHARMKTSYDQDTITQIRWYGLHTRPIPGPGMGPGFWKTINL